MIQISIKKRLDFISLSKSNIRFHSKSCLIISRITPKNYLINPHNKKKDNFYRFGITVSKKIGNAVVRNKIKRRCRHAIILINKENLNQNCFDYSIIAKKEIVNCSFQKIYDDLKFCIKHIKRLIKEKESESISK